MTAMILCALLAAVLYGVGAAFEQHQAAGAPDSSAGRPRLIGLLVRQPAWLLGIAAQIGGFAAHAVALRSGALPIVQMIIATELVVSIGIVRVRSGRSLSRTAWAAGAVVVAGIGAFLLVTSLGSAAVPGQGHGLLTTAAATGAALVVLARAAPASRTVSASRSTRSLTVTGISGM